MSAFMDSVFGPLSGEQCMFFYILMIFLFVRFVLILVSGIAVGISKGKSLYFYATVVAASLTDLVLYYICRVLYSMCTKSM